MSPNPCTAEAPRGQRSFCVGVAFPSIHGTCCASTLLLGQRHVLSVLRIRDLRLNDVRRLQLWRNLSYTRNMKDFDGISQ